MKTNAILILLGLLVLQSARGANEPGAAAESVTVIGSPPTFGTLNGVKFEHRDVDRVLTVYDVYICYRDRRPDDFKIGEIVYGYNGPLTATEPSRVIDRMILACPTEGRARKYYEVPSELYRDVTEPNLGKLFASQTLFSLTCRGSTLTVFLAGADGAYSYVANWIIDLGTNRVRRIVANGERDEGISTPWHALKKIDEPKIVNTPDKDG